MMIPELSIKRYCNHDACPDGGDCVSCQSEIIVDRTFADTIKVVLPCRYRQRFWVYITDEEAIRRTFEMKDLGIKKG